MRGARGNDTLLAGLQRIAVANNGRIHWGQRNDLTANEVAAKYGDRLNRWRERLDDVEHTSPSFSNPFSFSHGLEIELPGKLLEFYYDPGKPWIVFDLAAAAGKTVAGNPAILTKPDGVHVFARGLEPRDPPSPPPPRQLGVSVEPATIPARMTTTITIRTIDAVTGAPVTGTATVHNFTRTGMPIEEVWPTNQPQRLTGFARNGSPPPWAASTSDSVTAVGPIQRCWGRVLTRSRGLAWLA